MALTGQISDPVKLIFGLEAEPLINNNSFNEALFPRPVCGVGWRMCPLVYLSLIQP